MEYVNIKLSSNVGESEPAPGFRVFCSQGKTPRYHVRFTSNVG